MEYFVCVNGWMDMGARFHLLLTSFNSVPRLLMNCLYCRYILLEFLDWECKMFDADLWLMNCTQMFMIRATQLLPHTRFSEFEKSSVASLSAHGKYASAFKASLHA